MKAETPKDVNRIFVEDGHLIDEALKQGVRDAMRFAIRKPVHPS